MIGKEAFTLVGEILLENRVISPTQLEELKRELKEEPLSYKEAEEVFINRGLVNEEKLLYSYSKYFNIDYIDLSKVKIEEDVISLIPATVLNKSIIVPLRREDNVLFVAIRDPFDVALLDELKIITSLKIKPFLAKKEDILKAIRNCYGVGADTVEKLVEASLSSPDVSFEEKNDKELVEDVSLANYVNQLLLEAYKKRATDIHIEPFSDKLRIRFRIDGFLYETKTPPQIKKLHQALISRFKIMANLNIAEKRKPQDGRCRVKLEGQDIDLRLSTFPTLFGEGLSIRLLSKSSIMLALEELGFSQEGLRKIKSVLAKPNGMVLVTGPTGCGKTTTLYSFLNYLNDSKIKIVTLEDPIEYQLEGVDQIQINPKIGLTFANGLRAVLRQDPDIIMVGEIRDLETAQIAVRCALTGHLLFSTLHTNNSLSTITRLMDLEIQPYLLADTLKSVVAQRLVRLICPDCKEEFVPKEDILDSLGIKNNTVFFKGRGCKKCNNTGYKGRMAIFELLIIEGELPSLIARKASLQDLAHKAHSMGFVTLIEDGLEKAKKGLTSLEEVIRVCEQV